MFRFSKRFYKHIFLYTVAALTAAAVTLAAATALSIRPVPEDLEALVGYQEKRTYTDRYGQRLNITYVNPWNIHDRVRLHEVPEFMRRAFLIAEDQRFYRHSGVDWLARASALRQNLAAGRVVRGASTVSEQVVRMLHPRPRTLWSRWLEGFEAARLERRHGKAAVLEFYLNQVPYGGRRRGVVQAARYYFDRSLSTLSVKEMLGLVVMVRSPWWYDPLRRPDSLQRGITRLAGRMDDSIIPMLERPLHLQRNEMEHDLRHFLGFVSRQRNDSSLSSAEAFTTTLDLELQKKLQSVLDNRLDRLSGSQVGNGALLVVDHWSNEILTWVVGHAGRRDQSGEPYPFSNYDGVLVRRQPGSTLKPFLYSQALLQGWTAATLVDDRPLVQGVGAGMHRWRNYSGEHYGPVSLRKALGNSLNIPAVKTVRFVGVDRFHGFLQQLGITGLAADSGFYGDGLALGNAELSLYELVQAYTVLARMGDFKPLSYFPRAGEGRRGQRLFSEDVASLIADILSDPVARQEEFGINSVLNMPHRTAVKTGTSSDYRDAWALGYNDRYTVGVWMGNLDYTPMQEVTGASGPAWVLRSAFNELNRGRRLRPLYFSPHLVKRRLCIPRMVNAEGADGDCESKDEWFVPGTVPPPAESTAALEEVWLHKPSENLHLAMDPRIPDDHEYFEFALSSDRGVREVTWYLNGLPIATGPEHTHQWQLLRGRFNVSAEVTLDSGAAFMTTPVNFKVL